MTWMELISAFVGGIIALSALSLIVNPRGNFANVVSSLGDAIAKDVGAAKSFSG